MSVELKVTLVGEDPQQQQAFNNPQTAIAAPAPLPAISAPPIQKPREHWPTVEHRPLDKPEKPQTPPQAVQPTSSAKPPEPPPLPSWYVQPPPVQGQDQRLIYTLEQLIDAINQLSASKGMQPTTAGSQQSSHHGRHNQQQNWFDRIAEKIDKKIDDLGLAHTAVGDLVSGLSHNLAGLGTRVTKFASTALGGTGSAAGRQAATTAASSAATQTSAAAATGSGASSGATAAAGAAGASGALAASGPLIGVALAAGAAALSLKMFMDAIERTARDLSDLSPELAQGQAQHELKMELARLDRAKRIGSDVAGIDHAQHRLSESMYELQTKIYELILKASPAIEGGVDLLNVMVRTMDTLISTVNNIYAAMTPDPTDDAPAQKALADSLKNLGDAWSELLHMHQHGNANQMDPFLAEILANDGRAVPLKAPNRAKGGNP